MTYRIRHKTKYDNERDDFKEFLDEDLERIKNKAIQEFENPKLGFKLNGYMTSAMTLFSEYQLVLDEEKDYAKMQELLSYCLRFACSYFNKGYHPKQKVKVQYGEKVLEQEGIKTTSYMDYDSWLRFFYLFLITRCKTGINLFKHTSRERLIDSDILFTDEPDFCMVEFYQSLVLAEKDSSKAWQKAWDAIEDFTDNNQDPDKVLIKERMLMLEAPTLLLYQALSSGSSDAFNEQLEETLTYHQEYFDRVDCTGRNKFNSHKGFISWRILACCSIAHDSGLEIRIKSDYLPQWLYKGEVKDWGLKF